MVEEVAVKKTPTDAMRRKVDRAGADLAAATKARKRAVDAAKRVAAAAHAAGMTEVELADRLGVDRARTMRRWLGKEN